MRPDQMRSKMCLVHHLCRDTVQHVLRSCLLISSLACVSACQFASCGPHPRRLEFGDFASANRIEVIGTGGQLIATITDAAKIRDAAGFIERYHDGWIDVWTGPRAPWLVLEFYNDDQSLGHFGIAQSYLVAGSLSRDVSPTDVSQLAGHLGLRWPPER